MRGIPRGQVRSRVARVVDVCGLGPALPKKIGELSKGFRQRVGLAQAMIHEPDILILDEPTSGLDPNQIIEIRSLIKEIGKEKTVILSTHILPEVAATCDRVIIVASGKLVGSGTPAELINRATGGAGVSVLLRGVGEDIEGGLRSLSVADAVEFVRAEGDGLRYRLRARDGADVGALAEAVSGLAALRGWPLRELKADGASLEDVFRELTTAEDG
jgi:ABC-2 type transport system ATP-binding protein